jgi:hypothetical protein
MPFNPDATFDCLFVADRLGEETGSFTPAELHLFGYLACLLWLYRQRVVADWGYSFVGTELGAPFSVDIDLAANELLTRGYFVRVQDRLRMSDSAEQFLPELVQLTLNRDRVECLRAACASVAAFSAGMVGNALAQEPELRRARAIPLSRPLLQEAAQSKLYEHFEELRRALSQHSHDLRLPAVVWLTALYKSYEPNDV